MNCREAIEILGKSLGESTDGTLAPRIGWRLNLHLWCCRHCRNYHSSFETTIRLEKAAFRSSWKPEPSVPDELVAEILAAVDKSESI